MADVQIPELAAATGMNAGDLFLIRQVDTDKKLTKTLLEESLVLNFPNIDGSLTAGGAADVYTINGVEEVISYASGIIIQARFSFTNTGASTVNINGIGAKPMVKVNATSLTAGDIRAGGFYFIVYQDTNDEFQVINIPDSSFTRKDRAETIAQRWIFPSGQDFAPVAPVLQFTNSLVNYDQLWFDEGNNIFYFSADAGTHMSTATANSTVNAGRIRTTNTSDVTLESTGHALQLNASGTLNLAMDGNELQVRSAVGVAGDFQLQAEGGNVNIGLNAPGSFIRSGSIINLENNIGITARTTLDATKDLAILDNSNNIIFGDQDQNVFINGNTLTFNAAMPNDTFLLGNTTGLVAKNLIGMNTSDEVQVGDSTVPLTMFGTALDIDTTLDITIQTPGDIILNTGLPTGTLQSNNELVSMARITHQQFLADGVWNKPDSHVKYIMVEVCGGGGGGGQTTDDNNFARGASGGGGGGYARSIIDVSGFSMPFSVNVTVGIGGPGGVANSGAAGGQTGGTSSFINGGAGINVSASGGTGGLNDTTVVVNTSHNRGGFIFTGADIAIQGGQGQSGHRAATAALIAGGGGGSYFGGGASPPNTTGPGIDSLTVGGGGSGAVSINSANTARGGDGNKGIVIVTEYR